MKTVHGGTIRDYGPSDTSGGVNVARRSDDECFAKRANMRNDSFRPECASCVNPAIGGELVEMQGDHSATFRFQCGSCGPPRLGWSVIVPNMTTWVPVQKISPGIYRLTKLASEGRSCTLQ